ncbi:unnamed protein product [Acanthoscelides obtectus]|uniref:DRBM domain-containing protein n=1 Tax=Acanthoscelides obtectus TaxID=200917 RepID=A0A9P0MMM8_ACAOB|nr:unnamed protein product [Acanthoscelides obtectus]CAK1623327.1 Interferon-inducible double-stranded RNA-dependent protein kinase activator A [Acanthoscelides obtectus]
MSVKSPISVLQEITQQRGLCPPVYNIEHSLEVGHSFICTVDAIGITAKAYGCNKKDCKHRAAEKALDILGYKMNNTTNNNEIVPYQPKCSLVPLNNILPLANYVGQLNEFASARQFPYPSYNENIGTCLNFVVECRFLNWSTTGMGPNKKSAKQKAAQLILEKLQQEDISTMYQKFQNLSISKFEVSKLTDAIVEKYSALPSFGINSSIEKKVENPVLDLVIYEIPI